MRVYRRYRSDLTAASIALVLAIMAGCLHPPSTITTPQGQAAYKADQVVQQLTQISNLVKADTGSQAGQISYADAFSIIEWISGDANAKNTAGQPAPTTGLVQIVQTTSGQGWKAGALQSWTTRIKPLFQRYPKLLPLVDVVDSLLVEVL